MAFSRSSRVPVRHFCYWTKTRWCVSVFFFFKSDPEQFELPSGCPLKAQKTGNLKQCFWVNPFLEWENQPLLGIPYKRQTQISLVKAKPFLQGSPNPYLGLCLRAPPTIQPVVTFGFPFRINKYMYIYINTHKKVFPQNDTPILPYRDSSGLH